MRTKHFFFSAVLAASAFSACTNEDFAENGNVAVNGEAVNISIAASKGGDQADTRFGIDVNTDGSLGNQYWVESDMLGALLYTNADGSGMLTNYPFTPAGKFDENGKAATMSFKTPTAVSKGTYVFYTQYLKDYVDNGAFNVELADRQEMDPADPTAHISNYDFMIAPAVDLAGIKYGDATELPLTFRSIYNAVRFHIELKNATDPVTIQRIVIKEGSSAAFQTKSKIVPSLLTTLVAAVTDKWSDGKNKANNTEVLTNNGELDASKAVSADYQMAADALEVQTGHVDQTGGAASIVLAIKDGKTLKAGEAFDAYVLLPAGEYANGLAFDIYTDKGVSKQTIETGDSFKGLTAGKTKRINADLKYTVNDNNIELPTTFDIASDQDWLDAVAYVTTNYGAYGNTTNWNTPTFQLLKDVKGTLPSFKINVNTGANKLTLTGENNLTTIASDLTGANIVNEGTLAIGPAAGATAANPTAWTINSLTNKGTLSVATNSKLTVTTTVANVGSIVNAGEVVVTTTTTNGDATSKVAATITNTGKMTLTGALTNEEGATINVNQPAVGAFTLGAVSNNHGDISIADGATLTASTAALTNAGIITLNNAAVLNGGSVLDNENGIIIITDASKSYELTVPAGDKGVIKTAVSTLDAIKEAQKKVAATANNLINTIELTQSIKVEEALDLTSAVNLSLAANVKLEINKDVTVTCGNLIVAGAGASVAPYDKTEVDKNPAATVAAGSIEIAENATFDIAKNLTVGDACTALTVAKNASLTNNGTIKAGGVETEVKVNVAANGKLTNATTGKMENAKLKVETNAGAIINQSETAINVAGGMVGTMTGKFTFVAAS